jgi:DNA-binding NarL/FixJ family response regulator
MDVIKLLIIEDNQLLRVGIKDLLEAHKDIKVVSEMGDGENAVKKLLLFNPDIVLLDFSMQNQNVVEVVRAMKIEVPKIKIIGMGLMPTQLDIMELVQAGADGFILKNATVDDLIRSIHEVFEGGKVLPPPLTGSLFFQVVEHTLSRGKKITKESVTMSPREKDVIALIVEGMSNKEIATKLNIATYTVKSHVHNVMEKLALHSRLQISNFFQNEEIF